MSRRFGGSSETSRPAISTAPASTSSSPASMRSAVVLPDPDGPTSTMNSPSAISRSSASTAGASLPGYTRVACSNRTSAIDLLHSLRQFAPRAVARGAPCAQFVEPQQRGADDRRRGLGAQRDARQPGPDAREQALVVAPQHPAAE